jgi:hypothetical protein
LGAMLQIESLVRRIGISSAAASILLIAGCGQGNRAAVSGMVTLDGKPIEQGAITFFPAPGNKGPSAGGTITNGRYDVASAKGVAIGANKVMISSVQPTGRKIPSAGTNYDERLEAVPAKYNNETTLTCDVQPGKNEFNFELQGRIPIESMHIQYPGQR